MYETLLSPFEIGPIAARNRVFSPPHGTSLGKQGRVTEELIAYHETRARGGSGLIILEGMTLHPSYGFPESFLYAGSDDIIPGMRRLGAACRNHGTPVFGQLFHAGRAVRLTHDGSRPAVFSASDIPDERYRVVPVPMPNDMVWEIIDSYADAAARLAEADLDGVEILASMGYLLAQFLNPRTNERTDEFGGSEENRTRLLREIAVRCRQAVGDHKALGIRITLDEKTDSGMQAGDMVRVCRRLEEAARIDYFSVISGSTATPSGWVHVFPPMSVPHGFVAEDAGRLRQAVDAPVLVAGRINQPQLAESVLVAGKADMVGMARALIADPEFVNKVRRGKGADIRACVGCNQACVGHRLAHHPVSCIQHPVSGRELEFARGAPAAERRSLLVVGGGPAGMRAACVAADAGHRVTLLEATGRLGGQVNLAERLPGRAEFGGVTTNLVSELSRFDVDVRLSNPGGQHLLEEVSADTVILAVGARPRLPPADIGDAHVVNSWALISGDESAGQNVVIADWAGDWSGLGLAQMLAEKGHHVRLVVGASVPGESLQGIVRDHWIGELHRLGVETIPFARLHGADGDTAWFQHMISGEPIECETMDTLVTCYAPCSRERPDWLEGFSGRLLVVGDALSPRTVEEAVLEGHRAATSVGAD